MAEVTQYSFSWREVTELLIKKQDLHDGEWIAIVEYGIAAGMFGTKATSDWVFSSAETLCNLLGLRPMLLLRL